MGNVTVGFSRAEIDIGEDHDARYGMFQYLSAPAGFGSGVEMLAAVHAELFHDRDQGAEPAPR